MNPVTSPLSEFERNARTVLEESVSRIDGRTRSRLNQARQAAVEAATSRRRFGWRTFTFMPAAGAVVAAAIVALVLWHREPSTLEPPVFEGQRLTAEDVDLLADVEGLDLMEGWDGPFYEWAADQTDGNGQSQG
jgi:anti-sigma-K factor RskA